MKPSINPFLSVSKDVQILVSAHSAKECQWVLSIILMQDVTDAAELEDALRTQDADAIVSIRYM